MFHINNFMEKMIHVLPFVAFGALINLIIGMSYMAVILTFPISLVLTTFVCDRFGLLQQFDEDKPEQ